MPLTHLSIGSPIRFNRGSNAVGERAAVQRQSKRSAEAPGQSAKADAPVRRNTLVAAMMRAMQSLVVASPPAASPAAPATTAATATTATTVVTTTTARRLTAPERLPEPAVRTGAKHIPQRGGHPTRPARS